jgi:hypothetical protein
MGLIKEIYMHYKNLLAGLDADGDLTQTPIFDRLEREWAERGFAPIGK